MTGSPGCNSHGIRPVGATPVGDGKWHQSDLSGNVVEWAFDGSGPAANPCINCAAIGDDDLRAMRGGGAFDEAKRVRAAPRYFVDLNATGRTMSLGMRCARVP
jgi:formylglycine-generating enzyme required for sulfatase activity